jgi:putative flippase GtrA
MHASISRLTTDGGHRAVKYVLVSGAGVICTQVLLLTAAGPFGLDAVSANVLACLGASIPVFSLNRAWVWQCQGPASMRREIAPFWALTMLGLVVSTIAVAAVARVSSSPLLLSATNLGSFGLLWVAKFIVLDDAAAAVSTRVAPQIEPTLLDAVAA